MTDAGPDPLDFLFPPCELHSSGYLDVGDGHRIWWETSGAEHGLPLLLLHGGPGAPLTAAHRRFFDPASFRVITLHQRGCGKSRPLAETRGNTTQALVGDIEKLRGHLGIDRWLVVGGSWGTCLALAYGEAHPDRCSGFTLTGVTLGRQLEIDWWWHGTRMVFPEAYDALLEFLPVGQRSDPLGSYHHLVMSDDPAVHGPAAFALCVFSAATVNVTPDAAALESYRDLEVALPLARLALTYNVNRYFLRPGQLLDELSKITHLPCAMISGRYDVTTAAEGSWTLHKAWPGSTREVVSGGAHRLAHPGMARAFMTAIESMKLWP